MCYHIMEQFVKPELDKVRYLYERLYLSRFGQTLGRIRTIKGLSVHINIDEGTINDGGADDYYF